MLLHPLTSWHPVQDFNILTNRYLEHHEACRESFDLYDENSLGHVVNIAGLALFRCIWKSPYAFLVSSWIGKTSSTSTVSRAHPYDVCKLAAGRVWHPRCSYVILCLLRVEANWKSLKIAPWDRRSWNEIVSSIFWKQPGCSDPHMTGRETKRCWKASGTPAIKGSRFQDWACPTRFNCLYLSTCSMI